MRSLPVMWEWKCSRQLDIAGLGSLCGFGADWQTAHKKVLVWGDSHASHMAPLLAAAAQGRDVSFVVYDQCPASINPAVHSSPPQIPRYDENCSATYKSAIAAIQSRAFDEVILAAFWTGHVARLYDDQTGAGTAAGGLKLTETGLLKAIDDIGSSASITVIGDFPFFAYDPVPCALVETKALLRSSCPYPAVITADDFRVQQAPTYQVLRHVAGQRKQVNLVMPADAMCDEKNCLARIDGQFLYRDQSHIRRNLSESIQIKLAGIVGLQRAF